ncbi:MAG TPA: histidine kinase [Ktedonobacteraceae bacterium]|nr:histidine kinase [Ktedonobacteraceae bacterium]
MTRQPISSLLKPGRGEQKPPRSSRIQWRMTISYVVMTVAVVLLVEFIFGLFSYIALTRFYANSNDLITETRQLAQVYALAAAAQASGGQLDPRSTFMSGQAASLIPPGQDASGYKTVPYLDTRNPDVQQVDFALLIAPDGRVLASSYPARYPAGASAARLLPGASQVIAKALRGRATSAPISTTQGHAGYTVQPVLDRTKQPIGAIYVQAPDHAIQGFLQGYPLGVLVSAIFWAMFIAPFGGLFGWLTTRGLVKRIRRLAVATTLFADGDYAQRVRVAKQDEVGQLEQQFNRMAGQLVESIAQQQALAGQNARLAERSRLSRDLHDSVKQQVFAVTMQLDTALSLIDEKDAARKHLLEAEALAYQAQQELTTLIQELRPAALQENRLSEALRDYILAWSNQHGIAVDMHIPPSWALPQPVEEAFWRITQEALSNVARHSQATNVQIVLECDQDQVTLTIEDNGRGFATAQLNDSGVGLHSMRERMQALGGSFVIESHPGQGTRLVAHCSCMQPAQP